MISKSIRLYIAMGFLLGATACTHQRVTPDSNIDDAWLSTPKLNPEEQISKAEAKSFVTDFFDLLYQVIFDPNYRLSDLEQIKTTTIQEIAKAGIITREKVTLGLNKKIKAIHFSHLGILDPKITEEIIKAAGKTEGHQPPSAVSSRMIDNVGIIKVSSFLVPEITLEKVNEARRKVKKAKYLIYDLRNNGGGSSSSIQYLIGPIIGPGKTVEFTRNHEGIKLSKAVVSDEPFADTTNKGSAADIAFDTEMKYVERRTSMQERLDPRPTVILVNSGCGSSCEIFAAAVKEHSAAKLVGVKTAGVVLGSLVFKLRWKGYTAVMPVSQITSPTGNLYEGIGVDPDIKVESCRNSSDECINETIKLLKSKSIPTRNTKN